MSKVLRYAPCNAVRTVVPGCGVGKPSRVHAVLSVVFDTFPRMELEDAPILKAMFQASGDPIYHELAEVIESVGPVVVHLEE